MSRIRTTLAFAAGCAVVGASMLAWNAASASRAPDPPQAYDVAALIGTHVPDIRVADRHGTDVRLRSLLGPQGGVLVVLRPEDLCSCADFALELRILRNELPHLQVAIVGAGDPEGFRAHFRRHRVERWGYFDVDARLVGALPAAGRTPTPLVLVADSAGQVLLADPRPGPMAGRLPLGRLLPELACALRPGQDCTGSRGASDAAPSLLSPSITENADET